VTAKAQVVLELIAENKKFKGALDDSKKSAGELGKTLDQTPKKVEKIGKSADKVPKSFGGIKVAAAAAAAAVAALGAAAVVGLGKAISAAIKQEEAINAVANSLRLAGEASNQTLAGVQRFASELQKVTGIGDETTLQMFALAQSFGLTSERAKEVVTVSADYAARTGKSFEETVRQVGKSFSGLAGELGEVVPGMRSLTKEQLQAGEQLKLLSDLAGGSAASKLQTFGGVVGALKTQFGDFLEPIGQIITDNPVVIAALNTMREVLISLGNTIAENGGHHPLLRQRRLARFDRYRPGCFSWLRSHLADRLEPRQSLRGTG
jgi:phage-related minor tail protein